MATRSPERSEPSTTFDSEWSVELTLAVSSVVVLVASAVGDAVASRLRWFEGGRLLEPHERTLAKRIEAMDRLCLAPYSVAVAALGAVGSWAPAFAEDLAVRWYGSSAAMRWCLSLYVAKTAFDVVTQLATWRHVDAKRGEMLAHHVVSVVAIGYGLLVTKQCFFYGTLAIVTEASTFFLNNVMATKFFTGERTTSQKLFVALNGVMLWLSYLVCRLALLPFWFYRFFQDVRRTDDLSSISTVQLVVYPLATLAIFLLSCFWFGLITKGLFKALSGGGKKSRKEKDDGAAAEAVDRSSNDNGDKKKAS